MIKVTIQNGKLNELELMMGDLEHISYILKRTKDTGFDKVKAGEYMLIKLGAKNSSAMGYPDSYEVLNKCTPSIVGSNEHIALYAENTNDWFRTSPVESVKEEDDGYVIETTNSVYKLKKYLFIT